MTIPNSSYRYDQTAARLQISGMPDTSLGQEEGIIGILSGWKLSLVGSPLLEGKKEHLNSLMLAVLLYAKSCISGFPTKFIDPSGLVEIRPLKKTHQISLKSTKSEVNNLEVVLDDAELADLVRVLDDLRNDSRVPIVWTELPVRPIKSLLANHSKPLLERFSASLLGTLSLVVMSVLFVGLPSDPPPNEKPQSPITN